MILFASSEKGYSVAKIDSNSKDYSYGYDVNRKSNLEVSSKVNDLNGYIYTENSDLAVDILPVILKKFLEILDSVNPKLTLPPYFYLQKLSLDMYNFLVDENISSYSNITESTYSTVPNCVYIVVKTKSNIVAFSLNIGNCSEDNCECLVKYIPKNTFESCILDSEYSNTEKKEMIQMVLLIYDGLLKNKNYYDKHPVTIINDIIDILKDINLKKLSLSTCNIYNHVISDSKEEK